jgi:hypothetical protein
LLSLVVTSGARSSRFAARCPEHVEAAEQTELQRELDLQEELIAGATEGFIGRDADLA